MMLVNRLTGMKVGVMDMPGRKKPCLVVQTDKETKYQSGNSVVKYASFNNDLAASTFMMILAEFVGAEE